ncbi:DUF1983 domain-containing protein, partial [Vibrio metschnikovii]|nr:DUF1983 domain-containing protein [Vibrio metschnikovii]
HDLDGKIDEDAIKSFGYLTADDEQTDDLFRWYAGDDDQQQSRVGNVSSTSASNEQDYALARQIKVIQVKSGEMSAAISSEQVARISQNEALARDISSISAEVGDNSAKIINEQLARSSADEALAREILSLASKVGDTEARLGIEQKTRASEDDALSQQIITLTATVGDNAAAIFAEQTARADADSALAQDIQTLATQIGNAEAVVQQTSEALAELDGSVKANWQVKTQVRADGKVVQAGVGLGASIGADGQVRSEFLVMADTIGFLNTVNGEIHAPFVFDTVNDTAFLNSAIIGDATISFAKIQNDIQSENYVAGETGWKINKNGDVEFSDGQFRGTVLAKKIVGDITSSITKTKQRVSVQTSLFSWVRSAAFDSVSVSIPRDWDRTMYITVNLLLKEIQGEAFAAGRARLVIVSSNGETYYSNDYKITTADANSDKSQLSVDVGMYLPVPANATRTFTVYCEVTRHSSNRTFTIECSVGSTATNNVWVPLLLSNGGDLS